MERAITTAGESTPVATMVGGSHDFLMNFNASAAGTGGGVFAVSIQNGPADPLGMSGSVSGSPSFLAPEAFHLSSFGGSALQPSAETPDLTPSAAQLPVIHHGGISRSSTNPRLYVPNRRPTRSSSRVASHSASQRIASLSSTTLPPMPNARVASTTSRVAPMLSIAEREPSRRNNDISSPTVKESTLPRRRRTSTRTKRRPSRDEDDTTPPAKKRRASLKKPPPGSGQKKDSIDGSQANEESTSCCICMSEPKPIDLASISGCNHRFCFGCIEKWADRENTCPLCKVRFSKIDRVHKRKSGGERKMKNSKRVKQKDQRSDIAPGAALEGLLASLTGSTSFPPRARLLFSGMGNPFLQISQSRTPAPFGSRRSRPSERPGGSGIDLFSDTDEEEEGGFLNSSGVGSFSDISGLIRALPRGSGGFVMGTSSGAGNSRVQVLRPMSFTHYSPSTRSYASNMNDQSAGFGAENPLEIDDSDDEGEVEVVQVTRPV